MPTQAGRRAFAGAAARAEAAWRDFGRPGRPRLWGQGYVSLVDVERGNAYLRDYYAFTGGFVERIVAENPTSARRSRTSSAVTRRRGATSSSSSPRRPTSRSSSGSRRRSREGRDRRRRPGRPLPRDPAQEGGPTPRCACSSATRPTTFGWGVVFSEETLGLCVTRIPRPISRSPTRSRAGTGSTSASAGASCAPLVTRSRRSRAPDCSGSCRAAARLGAELEFGVEVEKLPDAISSSAPTARTAACAAWASSAPRSSRRARNTSGTDLVFDAFTFIFKETEHGLFNMHAYPYDEQMSTFIVECPEAVWRAAGLDEMDEEESLSFCERLFANDLRGRELFSNRSIWLDFPKVTNRAWHDGGSCCWAMPRTGALLDRLRDEAGDGGRDRAGERARATRWDIDAAVVDYEPGAPVVERTRLAERARRTSAASRATRRWSRSSSRSTC